MLQSASGTADTENDVDAGDVHTAIPTPGDESGRGADILTRRCQSQCTGDSVRGALSSITLGRMLTLLSMVSPVFSSWPPGLALPFGDTTNSPSRPS